MGVCSGSSQPAARIPSVGTCLGARWLDDICSRRGEKRHGQAQST